VSRFGPDPKAFFSSVYAEPAPWDVNGPQPDMSALLRAFPPESPVLDVGCGSGDLAIWLAASGARVVGVDFAEPAIRLARERARRLPPDAAARLEFLVADALRPSRLNRRFRTVVDSGFYHLFDAADCDRFVKDLARVLGPRGRYYLLAFATEFPVPNTPRRVTPEEIRRRFSARRGWRILELRPAEFQSRIAPVPAVAACVERHPREHRRPEPGARVMR
jgi:ubiquinone/menaquinone biosynthesis C-methylase UbiE